MTTYYMDKDGIVKSEGQWLSEGLRKHNLADLQEVVYMKETIVGVDTDQDGEYTTPSKEYYDWVESEFVDNLLKNSPSVSYSFGVKYYSTWEIEDYK